MRLKINTNVNQITQKNHERFWLVIKYEVVLCVFTFELFGPVQICSDLLLELMHNRNAPA